MKPGDFVKWYELYGDVAIVKDAGYGIIVDVYTHGQFEPPILCYLVLRSEHGDTMIFESHCLEAAEK